MRRPRGTFRNVIHLGLVSFFTDISTEMILGVLPIFIIRDLGATKAILGAIEGVADAVNYVLRAISGAVSDKVGRRKPLVLLGYGLSTAAKPLFGLANSWGQAFAIRFGDRMGKGIRTSPRDALISDSIPEAHSGKAFGLHRSLDQVGAVAGPLLAVLLAPVIGLRGVFWASFVPGVAALVILLLFVSEPVRRTIRGDYLHNVGQLLNRRFIGLLVALAIFSVGAYNFSFILVKAGDLGVADAYIPIVYAIINVVTVLSGIPAGALADKVGKEKTLLIAFAMFALTSWTATTVTGGIEFAFVLALLFGLYIGVSETVQRALIPRYCPEELKGTAYGVYYLLVGMCVLAANSIFGYLWDSLGSTVAFQYSTVTGGLGVASLLIFVAVHGAPSTPRSEV